MKKTIVILFVASLLLALTASVAFAEEFIDDVPKDSHKIMNKWDLSGSFTGYPGYSWDGVAGQTWFYEIHVKEAMSGELSKGVVHFYTADGVDVVGHVDATKREYDYSSWSGSELLAAVGTTVYNDTPYYFMFLYAERAVWFAISETPFDSYWASESVWPKTLRANELHSLVTNDFPLDYKIIHE